MPSHTPVSTAVKNVQKIINISAPNVGVVAATWTANVFLMPVDGIPDIAYGDVLWTATTTASTITNPSDAPGTNGVLLIVTAWDVAGEERANPFSSSFQPATANWQTLSLGDAWNGNGPARLSSCGYEIVDNTPQLYRGGNMVNWRKSSTAAEAPMQVLNGTHTELLSDTRIFSGFPDSLANAFRIPGATSTRFTEGAYVVGSLNKNKEDFETPSGFSGALMCASRPLTGTNSALFTGAIPPLTIGAVGTNQWYWRPYTYTHLDQSGSFCTGLSPETTFAVTLKATIEILPNATSVLIDFTAPAPPFSPKLEELYTSMVAQMPPSSPVGDNASGDFFKRMIKIATPIISTMFPTAAPVVNSVASLANKGIDKVQANRQRKKETTVKGKKQSEAAVRAEIKRLQKLLN